jgi:hypothetical protein
MGGGLDEDWKQGHFEHKMFLASFYLLLFMQNDEN